MTSPQKIARLAIALDEVKPPVRRRVEVQLAVRLDQLHRIIQIVMGWESYHLYEFRVGRDVVYGISYRDRDFPGTSPLSAKKATLADSSLKRGTRASGMFTTLVTTGGTRSS